MRVTYYFKGDPKQYTFTGSLQRWGEKVREDPDIFLAKEMKTQIINNAEIKGNLDFDGKIIFANSCTVEGCIRAQSIEGLGDIKSHGSIESRSSIKSRGSIEGYWYIKSGDYIESGDYIKSGEYIFSTTFNIEAKYIATKTLPFGKHFWAEMLPLRNWKKEIEDRQLCWDDYRQMITKAEAEKVCAWEGWHWILRAHLEMFFGLKEKYEIKGKGI